MPVFAVAYVYEELPRHDRVEVLEKEQKVRYFDKGVVVYEEAVYPYLVNRRPVLGLQFVEADDKEKAYREFRDSFPQHIVAATVASLPS